jgi:hypothetical protein
MSDTHSNAIRTGKFGHLLRWSSRAMFIAGCICAGTAAWCWFDEASESQKELWISIQPDMIDVGTMPEGISQPLRFEVANLNHHLPVIIFGATESCGPQGCIDGSNLPLTIQPGAKATLQFIFRAGSDPVFEYDLTIYSDAPWQTESKVKIVGKTSPNGNPEYY